MAFEKGYSGNPAGRKPGTPNKATSTARQVISDVLAGTDAATLQAKLASLDGKEFIDAYVKLAEFVTPKLQRTAMETETLTYDYSLLSDSALAEILNITDPENYHQ